jgi:hypothetical protein
MNTIKTKKYNLDAVTLQRRDHLSKKALVCKEMLDTFLKLVTMRSASFILDSRLYRVEGVDLSKLLRIIICSANEVKSKLQNKFDCIYNTWIQPIPDTVTIKDIREILEVIAVKINDFSIMYSKVIEEYRQIETDYNEAMTTIRLECIAISGLLALSI